MLSGSVSNTQYIVAGDTPEPSSITWVHDHENRAVKFLYKSLDTTSLSSQQRTHWELFHCSLYRTYWLQQQQPGYSSTKQWNQWCCCKQFDCTDLRGNTAYSCIYLDLCAICMFCDNFIHCLYHPMHVSAYYLAVVQSKHEALLLHLSYSKN